MKNNLVHQTIFRWSMALVIVSKLFAPLGNLNRTSRRVESPLLIAALSGWVNLERPEVRRAIVEQAPRLNASERRDLMDRYYKAIITPSTDLEAFARLAEFAAELNRDSVDGFVLELSRLALDAVSNKQAILAGPLGRLVNRIHYHFPVFPGSPALTRFGSSGFTADDGSNQVQHFWYSVAVTYRYGATLADLGAQFHEWNAPGLLRWLPGTGGGRGSAIDLALSRQGIELGQALAEGQISPLEVGQWLRENLGMSKRGEIHFLASETGLGWNRSA